MSFLFVKQKTAYEMRISDWSSDVCSSDLTPQTRAPLSAAHAWHVLLELAGDSDQALGEALDPQLAAAIDAGLIRDVVIAKNERESDDFWRLRDSISEAERAEGPPLQHDISLPIDLMPAFIAENPPRLERPLRRNNGVPGKGDT